MFWNFFMHVLSLDLVWLVQFIFNNIFWFFGFAAVAYYMSSGKKAIEGLVIISFLIMMSIQFLDVFQLLIYTALGLMLLYLFRFSLLLLLEKTPGGSRYLPLGWVLSWFVVLFIYNAFLV